MCSIHAEGAQEAGNSLQLYADEENTIRFLVDVETPSEQAARLVAECNGGGKVVTHRIDLRAVKDDAAALAQRQLARVHSGGPGKKIRPPLAGNPMQISQSELASLGYPPRPDPQTTPDALCGLAQNGVATHDRGHAESHSHWPISWPNCQWHQYEFDLERRGVKQSFHGALPRRKRQMDSSRS